MVSGLAGVVMTAGIYPRFYWVVFFLLDQWAGGCFLPPRESVLTHGAPTIGLFSLAQRGAICRGVRSHLHTSVRVSLQQRLRNRKGGGVEGTEERAILLCWEVSSFNRRVCLK